MLGGCLHLVLFRVFSNLNDSMNWDDIGDKWGKPGLCWGPTESVWDQACGNGGQLGISWEKIRLC